MDSVSSSTTQQPQQQQQQQFCLRWHNHQTSLLSTLPLLLDQSHLTDVTLSAEGKTLRAHRVVLSACSTFFSELFRTLDTNFHPVIIIPGASFTTVVALLTFMYSGEVNVFEEQIATLLTLAETLGIKGLADFQNNSTSKLSTAEATTSKEFDVPSPTSKMPSPLENLFIKSFQLYPNIFSQPFNFSQSGLSKTTELDKYQQQLYMVQTCKEIDGSSTDEHSSKRSSSGERKTKDVKRIDKIAENLRATSKPYLDALTSKIPLNMGHTGSSLILKPPPFPNLLHFVPSEDAVKTNDGLSVKQQSVPAFSSPENLSTTEPILEKSLSNAQQKLNNSKLYATCFICHKQLSNQYNLRVHLETHQNVRYACNVCSHVSRSKDALRKHVSYRHPGAPSLCETETRRKRSKGLSSQFPVIKNEHCDRNLTPPIHFNQPFMFLQNKYGASVSPQTTTSMPAMGEPASNETSMKKESANSD